MTMACKILCLNYASVMGGAEWSLLDVVNGLNGQVSVCLMTDGPLRNRLESLRVPVRVVATSARMTKVGRRSGPIRDALAVPALVGAAWQVAQMARGFDVIYANSQKALFVGAVAARLAHKPIVWHQRDILNHQHFNGWHSRLVVLICNRLVRGVFANSVATRSALVAAGVDPEKITVIYNGIDSARFSAVNDSDILRIRRELGLPPEAFVIGLFGRIAPWKGQKVLLEALKCVPGAHALIVGDALFGEEEYSAELRETVTRLQIADRVHFVGFQTRISQLMQACNVIVHTSVAPEAFGRVVVEGMLANRPVVASAAGGVVEIIEHDVSGLLVTPGDVQALASVIRLLSVDRDMCARLAATGFNRAKEVFSVEAMVNAIKNSIAVLADMTCSNTE
jgi:glycosyltransferase involved in cell wall biosynthesis